MGVITMALQWRDEMSVFNRAIDTDHQYLIEIVNRIEQSLKTRNRNELTKQLGNLTQYAQVHFEREERIALAAGYTQVPSLSKSHLSLMSRLNQVRAEFDDAGESWSSEAAEHFTLFLRNWLIDHVIKEDLLMKPALQKFPNTFDAK